MNLLPEKVNLFIIGAAKCGTTSLAEYLQQHPDVFMSPVKEPHFFSRVESNNKELYKAPVKGKKYHTKIITSPDVYSSLFYESQNFKIRFEASTSYLWDKDSPKKIYSYNSDAKIIAILRNPVDRAFSHYQMDLAAGVENNLSFLNALKTDLLKDDSEKIWGKNHFYVDLGFYYMQLKRYYTIFPSDNILILRTEDFKKDPKGTLLNVINFLKLDPEGIGKINFAVTHNDASHPRFMVVNNLKKSVPMRYIINLLFTEEKKQKIKRLLYKKGYNKKISIDKPSIDFLTDIYKSDLLNLKEEYNIVL